MASSAANSRQLVIIGATVIVFTTLYKLYLGKDGKRQEEHAIESLIKHHNPNKNTTDVDHAVSNISVGPLTKASPFLVPKAMKFTQNGHVRHWHIVEAHDVIAGIAFDEEKESFLLVKQFRPAVYYANMKRKHKNNNKNNNNNNNDIKYSNLTSKEAEFLGCTYELCAGLMDKPNLTKKETMKEEFLEELGYDVPLPKIKEITEYTAHTGLIGNRCTVFIAFINDKMKSKVHSGGGVEDENIQLVWVPLNESKKFIMDNEKHLPPGLKFAFYWFYHEYPHLCENLK